MYIFLALLVLKSPCFQRTAAHAVCAAAQLRRSAPSLVIGQPKKTCGKRDQTQEDKAVLDLYDDAFIVVVFLVPFAMMTSIYTG